MTADGAVPVSEKEGKAVKQRKTVGLNAPAYCSSKPARARKSKVGCRLPHLQKPTGALLMAPRATFTLVQLQLAADPPRQNGKDERKAEDPAGRQHF